MGWGWGYVIYRIPICTYWMPNQQTHKSRCDCSHVTSASLLTPLLWCKLPHAIMKTCNSRPCRTTFFLQTCRLASVYMYLYQMYVLGAVCTGVLLLDLPCTAVLYSTTPIILLFSTHRFSQPKQFTSWKFHLHWVGHCCSIALECKSWLNLPGRYLQKYLSAINPVEWQVKSWNISTYQQAAVCLSAVVSLTHSPCA